MVARVQHEQPHRMGWAEPRPVAAVVASSTTYAYGVPMPSPQAVPHRGTVYRSGSWPLFVRMIRTKHRISQAALTTLIGVGGNTVGRWERGECQPARPEDMAAVERLCDHFGVELAEAYRALGYRPPEPQLEEPLLRDLAELFRSPKATPAAKARMRFIIARELAAATAALNEEATTPAPRRKRSA